ncbi:tight junction protein ZO-1-like [Folsomia candida]|uniref:tight junction protein ZO-1-like n=1 Tax=Folsomia candida TaxID=158441 RepID=UPI00160529D6|nr:tight junction protein ZO-1-like [Folsomia candida]
MNGHTPSTSSTNPIYSTHHNGHSKNHPPPPGGLSEEPHPCPGTILLEQPVDEDVSEDLYDTNYGIYNQAMSRNISWEYRTISLTRVPGYGFGIAVSGGSDNPHFANGDPAIAISDVLKGGPAEGKLQINDRIITANSIKLENVDYGTAVQVLRDSGPSVVLIIKRRIIAHHTKITLNKLTTTKLKHIQPSDFGINLTLRVYIKESKNSNLVEGDEIISINGLDVAKLFDFRKGVCTTGGDNLLNLGVVKQNQQQDNGHVGGVNHQQQQSYDSNAGNLYVQPPTRRVGEVPPVRPPLPKESPTSPTPPPPPPPPPNHPNSQHHKSTPRFINFLKKSSSPLGLKLIGGNNIGIYIGALHPQTPAATSGLLPGDRILRVNDIDFTSIPRTEAVSTLSQLKPDQLVSFIVKNIENYREILSSEKYHDFLYYRISTDLDYVKRGEIVLIYDTLCNNGGFEGVLINKYDGKELGKKIKINPLPLENLVYKVKINWTRPVIIFSLITNYIYQCLEKIGARRKFCIVKGDEELVNFRHSGIHPCLNVDLNLGIDGVVKALEKLGEFAPVVLIVKSEDKLIKKYSNKEISSKKVGGSYGGSLLRSFNKSSTSRRLQMDLEKLESALGSGGWIDKCLTVGSNDNLGEIVGRAVEEIVMKGDVAWVKNSNNSWGTSGVVGDFAEPPPTPLPPPQQNHHQKHDIPNYNVPPPYSIHHTPTSASPHSTILIQQPQIPTIPQPPQPKHLQKPHPSQITSTPPSNYYTPTLRQLLAHSPVDFSPPVSPPPNIDRSKKPTSNSKQKTISNKSNKPIPPPKPVKLMENHTHSNNHHLQQHHFSTHQRNGGDDGYYLNLPMNSKIFQNRSNENSAFVQFNPQPQQEPKLLEKGSGFPIIQPNTTFGTFTSVGGVLIQRNVKQGQIPIQVRIPEGAIAFGKSETIWFHVVDEEFLTQGSAINGEINGNVSLMSPLIKFGPENLRFLKPIEIRIPQYNKKLNNINNAKVLLNSEHSWSKVDIKSGWLEENGDNDNQQELKIVSLTVQKF